MAFYLTCNNMKRAGAKNSANTNFLIFDISTESLRTISKLGFASCWKSKAVLPASRTAPLCRVEQHMSVDLANDQSRRQSTATAFPFNVHRLGQEDG